jgi:predicted nucleic acid-binding protein
VICLDTNIVIYLANGTLAAELGRQGPYAHSIITRIEALGYRNMRVAEEKRLQELFPNFREIPLDTDIAARTIQLRQLYPLSLGDAIIAATALEIDATLWTANTRDFKAIEGLHLYNPLT